MSLGLALAADERGWSFESALAVDVDRTAIAVHKANFPGGQTEVAGVETIFDGSLSSNVLTRAERSVRDRIGSVDILVAGPPCQGNSDLNNHTRRKDERNALYARMARAAFVLRPHVVMIENVPSVIHDRGGVVETTRRSLLAQGFRVADSIVPMTLTGVPQIRKRHVLIAISRGIVRPESVLIEILSDRTFTRPRTVEWAIRDLGRMRSPRGPVFDTSSEPSEDNARRMQWLIDNDEYKLPNELRPPCHQGGDHSYSSIYGRMRWNGPAQTITTGFGSPGQGCYVHPKWPRTITPHEAARIQTFPDFFDFSAAEKRTSMARLIGNAVPPFFMRALARKILPHL